MLIVFEGIDGAGKNTQIRRLLRFLKGHGVPYSLHKYPTKEANEAFDYLAEKKSVPQLKLAKIFADDIMVHQAELEKDLAEGKVVICDRYLHSTLAYQAVADGFMRLKKILLKRHALCPDLVLLLDIPAELGSKRKTKQKTPDRHEKDIAYLAKVRKNYLRMAKDNFLSYKYAVVDANAPKGKVFSDIITQIEPIIVRELEK